MSVTLRSVSRSRNIERSTLRRWRYRCGVSPKTLRKQRMKCAGDTCATAATVRTSSGSEYDRSIASRARSSRRLRSSASRVMVTRYAIAGPSDGSGSADLNPHHPPVVIPLEHPPAEVLVEPDRVRVRRRDDQMTGGNPGVPELADLAFDETSPDAAPSRALDEVDMELRRVRRQDVVADDRRRMDEADESGIRAVVRPRWELGTERGPPRPLRPVSEGPRVPRREAVPRHAVLIGGDEREVRFADDVRPDVDVPEQIRVPILAGRVLTGVSGQKADAVRTGQVVHCRSADLRHRDIMGGLGPAAPVAVASSSCAHPLPHVRPLHRLAHGRT